MVDALGGNSLLNGGRGHDTIEGRGSDDRVRGSNGRDRCVAERTQRCKR